MGNEQIPQFEILNLLRDGATFKSVFHLASIKRKNCRVIMVCLLILFGCSSKRDHINDPAISPVIIPEGISYNEELGAVKIEWKYLGVESVDRYRFIRFERDGPNLLDWINLPPPTRDITERADIWHMAPLLDTSLFSGELYGYTLQTQTELIRPAEEFVGNIQVPGGRLENIDFNLEKGTATVAWHVSFGKQRYELFRQIDRGSQESLFISENPEDTLFVDRLPGGNQEYVYFLRNYFDHNIVLNSRAFVLKPYMRDLNFNIQETPDAYMLLTPSDALNGSLVALVATSDACVIQFLGIEGLSNRIELPLPNYRNLNHRSLSLGVMPSGHFLDPHIIVASIESLTNQLHINLFVLRNESLVEIPLTNHTEWTTTNDATTAVAIESDGTIFIAAGQVIKIFEPQGQSVVEMYTMNHDLPDGLKNFVVLNSNIWALTNGGKLFRSPIVKDAQGRWLPFVWHELTLPANISPVWIGSNLQSIFVLDRIQNQVLTFNQRGEPGIWWTGLNDLNLATGGVVLSPIINDVYVWDAQNQIVLFKNTPPARLVFRTDEVN